MRFLVDECISRAIVEKLRASHHDVIWVAEAQPGAPDRDILKLSRDDSRLLLTADRDFGELTIRFGERALGVVMVAISQFTGDPDRLTENLVRQLTEMDKALIGKLTIIEAGRVRQRALAGDTQD
ncbi:MAG: DUF5615 family PIN-like protein [Propylenella sp.]